MRSEPILVTGGTGFVGRHLVAALIERGDRVRVLARRPPALALPATVEIVSGDLADPASLAASLGGAGAVVHLAACLDERAPDRLQAVNVDGTAAVARAARAAGVLRLVHLSSAGVYGEGGSPPHREDEEPRPGTAYERSKLAGERALAAELAGSEVYHVVLRPCGLYGPGRAQTLAFVRQVAHRRIWLHGRTARVHPTHVADVVQAILAALTSALTAAVPPGEVFNLGGERTLRFAELVQAVADRLGRRILQATLPVPGRSAAVNRTVDTARARAALGLEPIPLGQGLDQTIAWARGEGLR